MPKKKNPRTTNQVLSDFEGDTVLVEIIHESYNDYVNGFWIGTLEKIEIQNVGYYCK